MIEDLTGNIKRVVDGLADEIAQRVMSAGWVDHETVRQHARQVLLDWFLGEFIPSDKR